MKTIKSINQQIEVKSNNGGNGFYVLYGEIKRNENGEYFYTEFARENPRTIPVNEMPEEVKEYLENEISKYNELNNKDMMVECDGEIMTLEQAEKVGKPIYDVTDEYIESILNQAYDNYVTGNNKEVLTAVNRGMKIK